MKVPPASVKMETKTIPWGAKRQISMVYGSPPDKDPSDSTALVIAHGARKSMSSRLITFFHVEMVRRGFFTVKFNFPYMEARFRLTRTLDPKKSPRRMLSRSPWRSQVSPKPGETGRRGIVDGSRSRIPCCRGQPWEKRCRWTVLSQLSHSRPGRPEELGVNHLSQISRPMLFISGTRDRNARQKHLEDLVSKLGPQASLHMVEGADDSFNPRKGRAIYFKRLDHTATVLEDWITTRVGH